ncbi:hypothetical protein [Methylogaea oryzae]|uniref:hypothetical protein n=1 Tax=Methylogaea oryzae TaxID=1295382 RepID=UPI0006D27764|nr:hypothetical protein [Methylogaea oryzae]
MTPAGIVASGVGLRFEYRPVDFSVSDQLRAGRDNILIGEKLSWKPSCANRELRWTYPAPY